MDFKGIAQNELYFDFRLKIFSWFLLKTLRLLIRQSKSRNHFAGIVGSKLKVAIDVRIPGDGSTGSMQQVLIGMVAGLAALHESLAWISFI